MAISKQVESCIKTVIDAAATAVASAKKFKHYCTEQKRRWENQYDDWAAEKALEDEETQKAIDDFIDNSKYPRLFRFLFGN